MAIEKTVKLNVDIGDAKKNIKKLDDGVKGVDKSSKGAKSGLKGMTSGTKALGAGFKALGIGLIIAAFMKLKDLFSGNIETARKFEVMGTKLSAMFDVLRDRLEPLFMSLGKLFTDPLGSLKTFANAIKDNLINRVTGLIDTFGALGKVVKAVFTADMDLLKEGLQEGKTAVIQLNTGLDELQQNKVADTLKGITKEMNEEAKAAGKLTESLQSVRDQERDMLLIRAKANNIIAKSRLLAEDETKSAQERLVALKEAVAEEKRVADLEIAIQQQKTDALQGIIDLGKSSEEDMQNLASERARLIELQTGSILKQKRVVTEIVAFEKEIETARVKEAKAKLDRDNALLAARELNLVIDEELTTKEIEALIKTEEKKLTIEQKAADDLLTLKEKEAAALLVISEKKAADDKKIQDAEISSRKAANIDAAKSLLSSLGTIAGEGTKAAKASALAGMLIDTATGISGSISNAVQSAKLAGPGAAVVTPILIAQLIGQVLGGIGSARAILSQVPGGGGSGSTPNIDIATPTGIGAGELIPNIEAIDAVELGGTSPVQAFVVENDISNAQALQEELEIQATL
jgi:hypothetical protein